MCVKIQNFITSDIIGTSPTLPPSLSPALRGRRGGGRRRHCLILCKLFQSLQVFNRFDEILHSQLLQVSKFSTKLMIFQVSAVLHRIVIQTHYMYHPNIAFHNVHMVHPSCKQVHLNYSSYVQDGKLQCKHFTSSYL